MIQGLAERLKKLREKYHYSQKDVAKQLNISPSIVSGYETGERTPSAENFLLCHLCIIVPQTTCLEEHLRTLRRLSLLII